MTVRLALSLSLALVALVGCDDADRTTTPGPDLGTGDDLAPGGVDDLAAPPDLATSGPAALQPIALPLSATGHDRLYGAAFDGAGNLYGVGHLASSTDANADYSLVVAKLTPAGLDRSFGAGGLAVRNVVAGGSGELFRAVVVQSTGKIVVAGTVEHPGAADARDRDLALVRFNADGSKDSGFGTDGVVTLDLSTGVVNGTAFAADSAWGLARYADDRLVISGSAVRAGGSDTDFVLVRLSADGVRDDGFADHGLFTLDLGNANASARNLTILPGTDGIIGSGYQPVANAGTGPVVFKVGDDGKLDKSFGTDGVFSDLVLAAQTEVYAVELQPVAGGGYKLVTTGYGKAAASETTDLVSLRLGSDGKLDKSYGKDGLVRIDIGGYGDNSRKLMVLPDRRIVLFGGGRKSAADADGVIAVLGPDGAPDTSFAASGWKMIDLGGPADFLWAGALAPDGKSVSIVGVKGVGNSPMPAGANDDSVLVRMPLSP